ncbi:MAG: hypothetical protein AAGD92_16720 [Pseudomonadota bacterium]
MKSWLTTTPPLPDDMREAAQATGKDRYDGVVEALMRRLAKGGTLAKEVSKDKGVKRKRLLRHAAKRVNKKA